MEKEEAEEKATLILNEMEKIAESQFMAIHVDLFLMDKILWKDAFINGYIYRAKEELNQLKITKN